MKRLQLVALLACAAVLMGCETTTETAGMGNQERKHLAATQEQQQAQVDEGEQNLWSAQQNRMNRDSNPAVRP